MIKIIIITLIALFIFMVIKQYRTRKKLYEYTIYNRENLNGYIKTIENKTIDITDITALSGLIHKFLISDWLFNNQIRGSLKGAKLMVEISSVEQAKLIVELNNYFKNTIGGKQLSIKELEKVKEDALKLAATKMNEIFNNITV